MDNAAIQASIRFGFGPGPNDGVAGDPRAALKAQLRGPDPGIAAGYFDGLPSGQEAVDTLRADAMIRHELLTAPAAERQAYRGLNGALYRQDAMSQLAWAMNTPASFRERLVWFWANHFCVSVAQNNTGPLIGAMIREAIRPHVNGKFTDMVLAVERHPAMLRYLDNDTSVGPGSPAGLRSHRGLNENLGRECMELHTVGLAAGYSQADVTSMAKILTGWSSATSEKGSDSTGFKYRPNAHEPGPQVVMGRSFDGGEQAGVDALRFLATYPTTYDLLATKLVTHFVADDPPPDAVAHISGVLRDTHGDLHAASAALVDLPQAWAPGQKLKTPFDYVVSTLRAAPPPAFQPPPNPVNVLNGLGQPVWGAPLPNGWPDQAASWAGSDAIMSRIDFAYTYAARFDSGASGPQPVDIANAAMGPLLRPATVDAMAQAGSRREALTLFLVSPEFQRR
jgi:uncharacterized protein (DUF1800 family)